MTTNTEVYTTDFYQWCLTTAALVRAGQWNDIDPDALAEELESLGKSQVREVQSRLTTLMLHLLKWAFQPERRQEGHSWADTILEQRSELALVLDDNPSLRPQVSAFVAKVYPKARERAIIAIAPGLLGKLPTPSNPKDLLRLPLLPESCPWTVTEILDTDFWPLAISDLLGGHGRQF